VDNVVSKETGASSGRRLWKLR